MILESVTDAASKKALTPKFTQLDELRRLIEPQVIRRTKAEVAEDLPKKIPASNCRVNMSTEQRSLYVGALRLFNNTPAGEEQGRIHHLGLLQHLRLLCADPRQHGIETFVPEDPLRYRQKAPKMKWLLETLHTIRNKGEKVLIFAEHREMQRLLQHYIRTEFDFSPRIVNGDTSVSQMRRSIAKRPSMNFSALLGSVSSFSRLWPLASV